MVRSQGDYFEGDDSQNWVCYPAFLFYLVRELSDTPSSYSKFVSMIYSSRETKFMRV
jgi:hypothetical protein